MKNVFFFHSASFLGIRSWLRSTIRRDTINTNQQINARSEYGALPLPSLSSCIVQYSGGVYWKLYLFLVCRTWHRLYRPTHVAVHRAKHFALNSITIKISTFRGRFWARRCGQWGDRNSATTILRSQMRQRFHCRFRKQNNWVVE